MSAKKFGGRFAAILIAVALIFALLHDAERRDVKVAATSAKYDEAEPSSWLISPEQLFEGKNNMLLKPFVGPMAGAVAVHYKGPKQTLTVAIEYWKDGVKTNTSGALGMTLMDDEKDSEDNYHFDGHFVYSFQDRLDPSGIHYSELVYAIVQQNGYASSVVRVDKPAGMNMAGELILLQAEKVPLDESAFVWGLQATDDNRLSSYGSIAETLKSAKWAMALRLGFTENKH